MLLEQATGGTCKRVSGDVSVTLAAVAPQHWTGCAMQQAALAEMPLMMDRVPSEQQWKAWP